MEINMEINMEILKFYLSLSFILSTPLIFLVIGYYLLFIKPEQNRIKARKKYEEENYKKRPLKMKLEKGVSLIQLFDNNSDKN